MWLRIFWYLGEEASRRNWSWPSKWTDGERVQTLVFSTLAGQLGVARDRSLGPSPINSNHQELSQVQGPKCTNFVILLGIVPYSSFLAFLLSCSTSRELPEPLMGGELYQDWLEAGSLVNICQNNIHIRESLRATISWSIQEGDDKFDAVWNLLQHEHLPRENYKNIQYLFKVLAFSHSFRLTFLLQFLNLVTTYSEQNKMTASNLAIVITPNVVSNAQS